MYKLPHNSIGKMITTRDFKFHVSLLSFMLFTFAVDIAKATSLEFVSNYGPNNANVDMYYYIPPCLQKGSTSRRPALLVALHYCTGSAESMFDGAHAGPSFRSLADKYGFIVLYPNTRNLPDNCWDVFSTESLTRNGGGESQSIAEQVRYALKTWDVDPKRVFVVGLSSGAMMSNVLAALYPDIFAGVAVYGGVAYGCFSGSSYWSSECAHGLKVKSEREWGDLVRNAYPGYSGRRPKVQIWHNNPDEILHYINMGEMVKQWTNVFRYSASNPASTSYGSSTWTRKTYGANFQALTSTNYTHSFPIPSEDTIEYFGLTSNLPSTCVFNYPPTPDQTTTRTTPTLICPVNPQTTQASSSPITTVFVPKYSQCGGVLVSSLLQIESTFYL